MDPSAGLGQAGELEKAGRIDEAVEAYERLIERGRAAGQWMVLADSLHRLASALDLHRSRYRESLEAYQEEVRVRSEHHLPGLDGAHLGVARICHFLEDDDSARQNAEIARALSKDPVVRATAGNIIGDILVRKEPSGAATYLREAEDLLQDGESPYMLCHVRLSLALLAAYQGDLAGALSRCRRQMERAEELGDPGIVGTAHLRLAEVHRLAGDQGRAVVHAQQAREIGEKNNWEVLCREAGKLAGGPGFPPPRCADA